ncbi:uncharacterized protein LOC133298753 [Gastrolobium bilobum]|uniref:uncharacterized protein LOC133298753 n=1 Tax=Gastrolobium bilobum TaxID=150636 RepID=UPI002AB0720A|nr:uncharacterized protein LOC133298753 [Gastrolobium bilobum]
METETNFAEAQVENVVSKSQTGLLINGNGLKDLDHPDSVMGENDKRVALQDGMEVEQSLNTDMDSTMQDFSMNILTWNCRGAAKKQFKSTFSRFRRKFGVGVAAILEPRVSGNKALNIIRRLGFSNFIISDAIGYSGGIWVVWDPGDVNVTLIRKQNQFIHVWVEFPGKAGFFWTAVYASPQEENRRLLWEELKHIGRTMNEPWMLTGDFNEIVSGAEKKRGCPVDTNRCKLFSEVLDACGVMDLGGGGYRFTWKGPKFPYLDRVYKRLDRAVSNELWRTRFEDADALNLPRIFSDHCPVLVRMEKDWNKNVFGFILLRKNRVLARLEGIQRQMCFHNSYHLEDLEAKLLKELSEILDQEEQIWHQKSRGSGLKGVTETQGSITPEDLNDAVWHQSVYSWPTISEEDMSLLSLDISVEEVRKAFFQTAPLKTPGLDGFPALFYHRNWDLIKDQVFNIMK